MKAYFPWRKEYNINIREMDNQHMELVSIINELHQAVSVGEGQEMLGKVLDRLQSYVDKHFTAEEKLMKKAGYPMEAEHRMKHVKMRAKVESIVRDYKSGQTAMSFSVLKFLQDWLIKHIMGTDKLYAEYMNRRGHS